MIVGHISPKESSRGVKTLITATGKDKQGQFINVSINPQMIFEDIQISCTDTVAEHCTSIPIGTRPHSPCICSFRRHGFGSVAME